MGGAISESLTQQGPSWACRVGRIRKRHKKEQNFPRSQGRGSDPTPCVGCLPSLASSTALGSQGLQVGLGELGSGQWPQGEENAKAQGGLPGGGAPGNLSRASSFLALDSWPCTLCAVSNPGAISAHHWTRLWFLQKQVPLTRTLDTGPKHGPWGDAAFSGGGRLLPERTAAPASGQAPGAVAQGLQEGRRTAAAQSVLPPTPCTAAGPGWEKTRPGPPTCSGRKRRRSRPPASAA